MWPKPFHPYPEGTSKSSDKNKVSTRRMNVPFCRTAQSGVMCQRRLARMPACERLKAWHCHLSDAVDVDVTERTSLYGQSLDTEFGVKHGRRASYIHRKDPLRKRWAG